MQKHITQSPVFHPWLYGAATVMDVIVGVLLSRQFTDLWLILLSWVGSVVVVTIVMVLLYRHFLAGDIILTEQGIREERRWKPAQTPWADVIQAAAIETQSTRVLVLLRSGGIPMRNEVGNFWFFLRNPGKVIFLPDDKFTRAFVETYYGELEYYCSK